jgi:hypothetical protein
MSCFFLNQAFLFGSKTLKWTIMIWPFLAIVSTSFLLSLNFLALDLTFPHRVQVFFLGSLGLPLYVDKGLHLLLLVPVSPFIPLCTCLLLLCKDCSQCVFHCNG